MSIDAASSQSAIHASAQEHTSQIINDHVDSHKSSTFGRVIHYFKESSRAEHLASKILAHVERHDCPTLKHIAFLDSHHAVKMAVEEGKLSAKEGEIVKQKLLKGSGHKSVEAHHIAADPKITNHKILAGEAFTGLKKLGITTISHEQLKRLPNETLNALKTTLATNPEVLSSCNTVDEIHHALLSIRHIDTAEDLMKRIESASGVEKGELQKEFKNLCSNTRELPEAARSIIDSSDRFRSTIALYVKTYPAESKPLLVNLFSNMSIENQEAFVSKTLHEEILKHPADQEGTLLRSNSPGAQFMGVYVEKNFKEAIKSELNLEEFFASTNTHLELNPDKRPENASGTIEESIDAVKGFVQGVLERTTTLIGKPKFKRLASLLVKIDSGIAERFPRSQGDAVIKGQLFLRIISPAVATSGVGKSVSMRAGGTYTAKLLQNLANGTLSREEYMEEASKVLSSPGVQTQMGRIHTAMMENASST